MPRRLRYSVAIIPVLLGGGVPLLPDPADRTRLTLTRHRVYGKTRQDQRVPGPDGRCHGQSAHDGPHRSRAHGRHGDSSFSPEE